MKVQNKKLILFVCFLIPWLVHGAVRVDLPDTAGVRGNLIEIPVYILDDLTGLGVSAYQLQINYSNNILEFESADKAGTLTDNLTMFEFNQTAPNQITLVAAGEDVLNGAGILVKLNFLMKASGTATLNFSGAQYNFFNQGEPEMTLFNGRIVVSNPPVITINPNNAIIGPEGQANFSVSGGQSPYTWSLSNPSIAEIVSTGNNTARLTATTAGFTQVIVEDNTGIRDTTNGYIEIRPLALSLPDTSVIQGQTLDIPVRISEVTDLAITSGALQINFDASRLSVLTVIKEGAMIGVYDNLSFNIQAGKVNIAFAGNTPLSGAGDLLAVRFQTALENYGNTTISISDVVFNQDLLATVHNGICTIQRLPQLSLSPNTATLLTGETLQFSIGGTTTPPLTWVSGNPTVASIDDAGLLSALASGVTRITVTDFIGASVTSGDIEVFDTRISLPDTTGIIGGMIDVPVKINPVPVGVPIFAIQGVFSFNINTLKFIGIFSNASGLESWSITANQDGNDLRFAAAGATPVTAGEMLFNLRFMILAGAVVGQKQNLQIKDLLLNEGNPAALTKNGSITAQLSGPPETPILYSPGNGTLDVPPFGAKFCWHTTLGAQKYNLQISGESDFDPILYEFTDIADTCFVVDSLGAEQNYFWRVKAVNNLGESTWSAVWQFSTTINGLERKNDRLYPDRFVLHQNYPNPFNPITVIEFSIVQAGLAKLQIFNSIGESIAVLVNEPLNRGTYRITWNAENRPSGIYYYRLLTANNIATRRMLLIR